MSDTTTEEAKLSTSERTLAVAQATKETALDALSESEKAQLENSVLFPSTYTGVVEILGVERELRPLPIKWSKKINHALAPLTEAADLTTTKFISQAIGKKTKSKDLEFDMLSSLLLVSDILAEFYGWDDVREAIKEEDLTIDCLQALVIMQQGVQNTNDFLLIGLRIIVNLMQAMEIAQVAMTVSPNLSTKPQSGL